MILYQALLGSVTQVDFGQRQGTLQLCHLYIIPEFVIMRRGHRTSNIRVRMFDKVLYFWNIEMFDVRMFANIQMFESSNVRMFAIIWMFKRSMFESSDVRYNSLLKMVFESHVIFLNFAQKGHFSHFLPLYWAWSLSEIQTATFSAVDKFQNFFKPLPFSKFTTRVKLFNFQNFYFSLEIFPMKAT